MSTSEEIPPSAKDWVKSSALYPFSPFCWHLPLLLSSVSCSTSRCVVCFPLHVTYNLLTSASYILHVTYNLPQGSTLTITYYDGVLPTTEYFFSVNDACLNLKIFICLPYYLWLFPFFFHFWQTVSDKKMINLSIFVFLCTFKPEHVYVTIYVKSWSINNFLSKNLLLPTVCLILYWELITTQRDGLNLLT